MSTPKPAPARRLARPSGRRPAPRADAKMRDAFPQLRLAKEESLRDLLKRKPGEKHYRRSLKTYLEADHALQTAIIRRLDLDFRE